jgi:hypothetical protein
MMAAPKGNKYALGNTGGRPRIYDKPEDLAKAIDAYFEYIKGEKKGNEVTREPEPATITGLALYLGFASRQSLLDYVKEEEFSFAIKRGKLRIEHEYEKRLHQNNPTGAIFGLKNMDWNDKQELEHSGSVIWNEIKKYGADDKTNEGS